MATIGSYPSKSFSPLQKFLVINPETQTTALVSGGDIVDYITPTLDSVKSISTVGAAQNENYDVGVIVQTAGDQSPGDGEAAVYLVVPGGQGELSMANGNELLRILGPTENSVQSFRSVADLTVAQVRIGDSVSTLGYYTPGDGGGCDYEIVAAGTGSNFGFLFEQLNNGLEAKLLGGGIMEDKTAYIPADYSTLQEAIDDLSMLSVKQGVTIDLVIEAGHQPESGISVRDGDYRHFSVSSIEAEVLLPSTFTAGGIFIAGSNCAMPVLNCLVNSQGNAARGYSIASGSGQVNAGCGVKGTTGEGLWVYYSRVHAPSSVWSNGTGYAMRISRGSQVNADYADCTNCTATDFVLYVNRGSIANLQGVNLSGCTGTAILHCRRGSKVNAHDMVASNCIILNPTGFLNSVVSVGRSSECDVLTSTFQNNSGRVFTVFEGGRLNARSLAATVTDDGTKSHNFLRARNGSNVAIGGNIDGFNTGLDIYGGCVVEMEGTISNCATRGIDARYASIVSARSVSISGCGVNGVFAMSSTTVDIADGSIKNSGANDITASQGSFVNAAACETTNGAGGPSTADTLPSVFNSLSNRGVIWA